ncbi:MAG: substrate-binding domain-containing protein [Granulosicoccus sp.]|nr:substrate-binding domain-containing protein [Granulosicoccus sp.]
MKNKLEMNRRNFLKTSAAGLGAASLGLPAARLLAQEDYTLVLSMRSLANPYHATFAEGGKMFAESVGLPFEVLVTEGNSEKGISDVRALLARTDGKMVLNIDPNDSPDARTIVEDCAKAGAYVVTQWNKPDDLHPWDFDPNYVAHMSFDGVPNGKAMGEALINSMGGSGGIVALGGILNNVPAIERKLGLDQAIEENSDVQLLDFQAADWNETKAFEITQAWLTRFGPEIKGIWAANDGMGIGALEALRQEGLAGQVPVTGIDGIEAAIAAVKAGEFAGTVAWDPLWTGGMGMSIGYHTAIGEIDIAKEPKEHREFYGQGIILTEETVGAAGGAEEMDWKDFWGKTTGQIQYRG